MIAIARPTSQSGPSLEEIQQRADLIQRENLERLNDDEDLTRIDRRGGPRLLLVALIKNAVNTLEEWGRRYNNFHSRPYEFVALRNNAKAAYAYLMSDSRRTITAFRCVCDETGADAEAVRELVARRVDAAALRELGAS